MVSDRLDALVDTHFDAKSELTISKSTIISKDKGPKPKLSVRIDDTFVAFPFPDRPLPNKIRFKQLQILYINHSVIEFIRSNKQIWDCDRMGTKLELNVSNKTEDNYPIWEIFGRQIWPIFAPSIRHLTCCDHLDNLRRHISPTLLTTGLDQLISIDSGDLFPDAIADDGPNATAGQALSKWLHTPRKNGQPKRLLCAKFLADLDWINDFKETFLRATASVSYKIRIGIRLLIGSIEPFELVNERTKEKLILEKKVGQYWLLKRCPIIVGETAAVWWENDAIWDDNLKNVKFNLFGGQSLTGTRPKRKKNKKKEKKRAKALKRRRIPRK